MSARATTIGFSLLALFLASCRDRRQYASPSRQACTRIGFGIYADRFPS